MFQITFVPDPKTLELLQQDLRASIQAKETQIEEGEARVEDIRARFQKQLEGDQVLRAINQQAHEGKLKVLALEAQFWEEETKRSERRTRAHEATCGQVVQTLLVVEEVLGKVVEKWLR